MEIPQRTLPHILREIADKCDRETWCQALWRAAKQLEILYLNSGLHDNEVPELTGVRTLEEARKRGERALLVQTLFRAQGNRTLAAEWLGIDRIALYNQLHKHGMMGTPQCH